jgi:hypothetical protein
MLALPVVIPRKAAPDLTGRDEGGTADRGLSRAAPYPKPINDGISGASCIHNNHAARRLNVPGEAIGRPQYLQHRTLRLVGADSRVGC